MADNGTTRAASKLTAYIAEYWTLGWADYKANAGFASAYDTWHERDQKNYENGRLGAADGAPLREQVRALASAKTKAKAWSATIEL